MLNESERYRVTTHGLESMMSNFPLIKAIPQCPTIDSSSQNRVVLRRCKLFVRIPEEHRFSFV
jgi:hypothetical protein